MTFASLHEAIDWTQEHFWPKVRRGDGCWEWTACLSTNGYGKIGRAGVTLSAHRVSWEIHNGPIPTGMFVCHHCDNRACVRPDHLFLGTALDNARDMWAKGRAVLKRPILRGSDNPQAILTATAVADIRAALAAGAMATELGRQYRVSDTTIGDIKTGRTWRSVA